MRNAVLVVMVLLLAAMVAAPVSARTQYIYDRNGNPIAASEDGFESMRDNRGDRIGVYEYTNGPSYDSNSRRYGGNNSSYGSRQDNYGYSSGRRGKGNSGRTGINVGLGTRVGGVQVNLGYNKVTYSKPTKPKPYVYKPEVVVYQPAPNVVMPAPKPPTPTKCRMTLVEEIGDGLETISPIVVTNPEKVLVTGARIVFNRNGQFFAEYAVIRISGDSIFVETIDAPCGKPRQGDTFKITSAD